MASLDEATIRATVIAHAIRLGKCPEPGIIIDFEFRIEDIEADDLSAGRLDKAIPVTESRRVAFEVTAEDIAAGRQLINTQEAVYREPKLTQVKLKSEDA